MPPAVPNEMRSAKLNVKIPDNIRTIIFDLDGTIYDKRGLARRMVRRLWWCLPLLAAERMARRNMHYFQFVTAEEFFMVFFRNMARGHWWGPQIAEKWYFHVYMPAMVRLIHRHHPPRPEMLSLFNECRQQGIRMAIFSDYGCVEEKLEALGIDASLFDLLISAPELGALKPSKPVVEQLMNILHADPATTLFIGDRDDKDGASARAVGARYYIIS